MKQLSHYVAIVCLSLTPMSYTQAAKTTEENILWPNGIIDNPITYVNPNRMRNESYHPDAPLQSCRVYSNVQTPTYYIYQPAPNKNTGVSMVVLPGGGYRDIWLDTEGHNIALFYFGNTTWSFRKGRQQPHSAEKFGTGRDRNGHGAQLGDPLPRWKTNALCISRPHLRNRKAKGGFHRSHGSFAQW